MIELMIEEGMMSRHIIVTHLRSDEFLAGFCVATIITAIAVLFLT